MNQLAALAVVVPLFASTACSVTPAARQPQADQPTVVLLHGLARSASSMDEMEAALRDAGHRVCNVAYPSREHAIAELAAEFVAPSVARCVPDPDEPVSFVTHSLGGIIVRELARTGAVRRIGRVVMLGPPNHGSEVVDAVGDWYLFGAIHGPAGSELGTAEGSVPQRLGPTTIEVGVIAGHDSINWINSLIIPGDDDGKVSVQSAKLEGMRDFIVVAASHPYLMKDADVIAQTLEFLAHGCFAHDAQATTIDGVPACTPAP